MKTKKGKKRLYIVKDGVSLRSWVVMARSYEEAEKMVEDNIEFTFLDGEYCFDDVECADNGVVEITTKIIAY